MGVLRISLFGSFQVCNSDPTFPAVRLTRAIQCLLAYLLLEPRLHSRETLAGLFWKEQDAARARGSLNTALWRLRQALEPRHVRPGSYLLVEPYGDVGFNWESDHWLDVEIFGEKLKPALRASSSPASSKLIRELESTLALYKGDLLEGIYEDWALREREAQRQLYLNGLALLMKAYGSAGSLDQSLDCGRRILDLDPLREEIHREMMRLYVENGQRSLAHRQYETCRRLLQQELGIQPMEETQHLYTQLLTGEASPPTVQTTGEPGEVQQILDLFQSAMQKLAEAQGDLQRVSHRLDMLARRRKG